jgi:predicted DNA-binding transcriptional regulator YafY
VTGSVQEIICRAIAARRVISFSYKDRERTVEPYLLAYNKAGNLAVSAWFLTGSSDTGDEGWRAYLLDEISDVTVTERTFDGRRPGYRRDGGKSFHDVQCAV